MTQWHHVNSFKLVIDKQLIQLFNTENKILFTKKKLKSYEIYVDNFC